MDYFSALSRALPSERTCRVLFFCQLGLTIFFGVCGVWGRNKEVLFALRCEGWCPAALGFADRFFWKFPVG